ncbi:MAG: hypothetical protein J6T08_07445 [Lentisphaeria bacterium]|nr:hypothetical protein [Lentisphaeria bacterium]
MPSFAEIGTRVALHLTMLAPEIIHRAIRGTLPPDISLAKLYKLPDRWDEQLKQVGIVTE